MKLKRVGALNLYKGLEQMTELGGKKFKYFILANLKSLQIEKDICDKLDKKLPEFENVQRELEIMAQKYARKNEDGTWKLKNGNQYDMPEDEETRMKWMTERDDIVERNKEIYEKQKIADDEYRVMLNDDIEFNPFMIDYNEVPENLTTIQMATIFDLIKEPN